MGVGVSYERGTLVQVMILSEALLATARNVSYGRGTPVLAAVGSCLE